MLNRLTKSFIIAATALTVPAAARAAAITLTYNSVQVATDANFTQNVQNLTIGAGNVVTVPAGDFVQFGVAVAVTGNPNTTTYTAVPQPLNLGLGAFGASFTDSANSVISPQSFGGSSSALVNSLFSSVSNPGVVDNATGNVGTGVVSNEIAGGLIAANVSARTPGQLSRLTIGASATASDNLLFSSLAYNALAAGTATLTPNFAILASDTTLVTVRSAGSTSTPPVYDNRQLTAADVVTGPGNLTVIVTAVPEPASLGLLGVISGLIVRRRR